MFNVRLAEEAIPKFYCQRTSRGIRKQPALSAPALARQVSKATKSLFGSILPPRFFDGQGMRESESKIRSKELAPSRYVGSLSAPCFMRRFHLIDAHVCVL